MTEYALILVSTILVNNFVLSKFLGLCPFMGVSRKLETAIGMGMATTFVMTLSSISSYLLNEYLLAPLGLGIGHARWNRKVQRECNVGRLLLQVENRRLKNANAIQKWMATFGRGNRFTSTKINGISSSFCCSGVTVAFLPPIDTVTSAKGIGNGSSKVTLPSTPYGSVTPSPVPKIITTDPDAAGLPAVFTE